MSKRRGSLSRSFLPEKYRLEVNGNSCRLLVLGRKLPPPSKRVTLHQRGLRIRKAEITSLDKKQSRINEIKRINHLPTFEEVRIHTTEIIYPGQIQVILEYRLPDQKLKALVRAKGMPSRELMPSVDEDIPGDPGEFELIYTNDQEQ